MAWTDSTKTIADWLAGLLNIIVPVNSIESLLDRRNIAYNTPIKDLTEREADLLKADLYVWFCTSPSTGQTVEDADGDWKHKEGSYSLLGADRSFLLGLANDIYAQYDEPLVKRGSVTRLINL